MGKKEVEMARLDPVTNTLKTARMEIDTVRVKIKHNGSKPADVVYNDVVAGRVLLRPGEEKNVEVSQAGADELKELTEKKIGAIEYTGAGSAPDDEEEADDEEQEQDEDEGNAQRTPRVKRKR